MANQRPEPSRFDLARRRRGLTKVALAGRAGITTRSLTDIESGRTTPSEETINAIADALRFPAAFFYRPEAELLRPEAASFRSLRSLTAGQRDASLAAGALAGELSAWIDERYELPAVRVPDFGGHDPEAAAGALRAQWGIGERPIGNMVHLLESVGVRVFSLVEDRRVDAFSLWHHEVPFVFLNTVKTAEHSRMDAAHELGHLALHRHGIPWGQDVERDAQRFAAAFLMPRASVLTVPRLAAPTLAQVVQLKQRWLVSALALVHRLHSLDLLSPWNYRNLCVQLSKYGRTREPAGIPRETSQIMAKVFGAGGAQKSSAAGDLGIYPSDIEALVFGLRAVASSETARTTAPVVVRGLRLVTPPRLSETQR